MGCGHPGHVGWRPPCAHCAAGEAHREDVLRAKPLLTIHARGPTKLLEPASAVHGNVIGEWAGAVWLGWPPFEILDAALRQARKRLENAPSPWLLSVDAASAFLLTCARLRWQVVSAREFINEDGIAIDMLTVAPLRGCCLLPRGHRQMEHAYCLSRRSGYLCRLGADSRGR